MHSLQVRRNDVACPILQHIHEHSIRFNTVKNVNI